MYINCLKAGMTLRNPLLLNCYLGEQLGYAVIVRYVPTPRALFYDQ